MINVLFISMVLPYNKVAHAGGKTFYYYIKALNDDCLYHVSLIAKILPKEKFDKENLGKVFFFPVKNRKLSIFHPISSIRDIWSKINPFSRYGNTLRQCIYDQVIDKLHGLKETPDIIVLEFSEMVLLAPIIRKLYPTVKIFASEHDVSYLGYLRSEKNEKNIVKKIVKKIKYRVRKRYELMSLSMCDLVMPHNLKDKKLLVNDGILNNNIYVLTPFFHRINCVRTPDYQTILFYGAMDRNENVDAVIWFIENVLINIISRNIRFVVLGANPQKRLLKYQSSKIVITGYVEDISSYFASCTCMVAPLRYGAGIKVKILEAFSAGIPVLTNDIGIEGIRAINNIEYIHCNQANDYVFAINKIFNKELDLDKMSENERSFMDREYNLKNAILSYKSNMENIYDKQKK